MYKNNSKNMQGRASRLVYKDVVKSDYEIEPEEEYESLKSRYSFLQEEIRYISDTNQKENMAKEYREIGLRLTKLKPLVKRNKVDRRHDRDYFIGAAKIVLPEHLYNAVWKEAEIIKARERKLHGLD